MRFPDTKFMKRTFKLADMPEIKKQAPIIPYNFSSPNTVHYFNGRTAAQDTPDPDPYDIAPSGYIPPQFEYLLNPKAMSDTLASIYAPLKAPFDGPNIAQAMQHLFKEYDQYSMRTYLNGKLGFPSSVVNLMETFDKSTGWYDRGLVESVCESLAFQGTGSSSDGINYYCFE